jgi:hypothetical protein
MSINFTKIKILLFVFGILALFVPEFIFAASNYYTLPISSSDYTTITIHDNSYGVLNTTSDPITAEYNYWGDPSGPYNTTSNPTGTGNPVTDNVDFTHWLSSWP